MRPLHTALRHKVALEQKISTPDGMGGTATTWQQIATLWAEIIPLRASETSTHSQVTATASKKFRMRYNTLVQPDMRLVHDGVIFNIRSITNVEEKKHTLEITAESGGLNRSVQKQHEPIHLR